MSHVDFFKLQAKNLFRDYKTKTPYIDKVDGFTYYNYTPEYFDVDRILLEFDYNEEKFSLMQAQHIIALMVGFRKWADLLKASDLELELAKLLFDHQDKIGLEDWEHFMAHTIELNNKNFDLETWIEIFKEVFVVKGESHHSDFEDYRIKKQVLKIKA